MSSRELVSRAHIPAAICTCSRMRQFHVHVPAALGGRVEVGPGGVVEGVLVELDHVGVQVLVVLPRDVIVHCGETRR